MFYFENEKEIEIKNTGYFYKAIKNKSDNVSKQEVLKNAVLNFKSFESEVELEKQNKPFFEIAEWLAINRNTAKPAEILKKLKILKF